MLLRFAVGVAALALTSPSLVEPGLAEAFRNPPVMPFDQLRDWPEGRRLVATYSENAFAWGVNGAFEVAGADLGILCNSTTELKASISDALNQAVQSVLPALTSADIISVLAENCLIPTASSQTLVVYLVGFETEAEADDVVAALPGSFAAAMSAALSQNNLAVDILRVLDSLKQEIEASTTTTSTQFWTVEGGFTMSADAACNDNGQLVAILAGAFSQAVGYSVPAEDVPSAMCEGPTLSYSLLVRSAGLALNVSLAVHETGTGTVQAHLESEMAPLTVSAVLEPFVHYQGWYFPATTSTTAPSASSAGTPLRGLLLSVVCSALLHTLGRRP